MIEWATRNGYRDLPTHTVSPGAHPTTKDPYAISVRVTMGTLALHTFIRCRVPGWHGSGGSWGVGLAAFACSGTLDLADKLDWAGFTARTALVRVVAGGQGSSTALLIFADEAGSTVGSAVLSGLGAGAAIGFTGGFVWR